MDGASKLLIHEAPLQVLPSLAELVGLNEAIILQQIHYWIREAEKGKRNYHDGYYWVYNSIREWHAQLPFWSENTVQRIFAMLEEQGLIISDNYNQTAFDRTKWYRIDYAKLTSILEDKSAESISPSCDNPRPQDGVMEDTKMGQPIPETTRDIHRLPVAAQEIKRENGALLSCIQSLPYWAATDDDDAWLDEFTQEHTNLTTLTVRACRDYWDGKPVRSKGIWKNRLRNWCRKEREFGTTKHSRALPKSYTPTGDYPDL